MRYFDDGDLTEGLAIAAKPYPFELLLGYWHAVSTCWSGERTTVDYDDPEAPAMFRLELEYIEGAKEPRLKTKGRGKRQRGDGASDDLQVTMNYRDWNLEFSGNYATEEPATVLYLSSNDSPDVGDVDKEATLAFGSVLDDRGYPFLRIMLSACEAASGSDDMVSIEIVAKKTDTTEVHKLELSKNERLRLGYAVRSDGQFEDLVGAGEPKESYEELTRQLGEHTAASARIALQLQHKRQAMDEQLREAAESGKRVRSIYNEQRQQGRLSLPARPTPAPGGRQSLMPGPSSSQMQQRPSSSVPRPSTAPRPSTLPRTSVPPHVQHARAVAAADDTPIIPGSVGPGNQGKKHCRSCNRTVSLNHGAWVKHINSKKHAEQAKRGPLAAFGPNGIGSSQIPTNGAFGSPGSRAAATGPRATAKPKPRVPRGYALIGMSDEEEDDGANDDDDDDDALSEGLSTPSEEGRSGRTRTPKGETQWCKDCECQISVKNWNIHTRSNKHRFNAEGDEGERAAKRARISSGGRG